MKKYIKPEIEVVDTKDFNATLAATSMGLNNEVTQEAYSKKDFIDFEDDAQNDGSFGW